MKFALSLLPLLALLGCASEAESPLNLPRWFPEPRVPAKNPVTEAKIELGRYLFYDRRLSGNATQSCSSCHLQELAFSDGRTVAVGSTGERHPRNSPTLTNAAYNATLTWANPLLVELETQLLIPLFGDAPVEMGAGSKKDEVLERFQRDSRYQHLQARAFPGENGTLSWNQAIDSLATFTRAIVSANSRFDRFVYQDDVEALTNSAKRGMELFYSERLECHHCHGGFNFTESSVHANSAFDAARFHNTGLYNIGGTGDYPADNTGLFEITGDPSDMGKFRAPTLRNVEVTAPYMHDGSIEMLSDVIRFYEDGGRLVEQGPFVGDGRQNQWKSGFIAGFELSDSERDDLVHFLESLTDRAFLEEPRLANPFSEGSEP